MNIKERLTLLKAGYSKDEINAMLDEEKKAPSEEKPDGPAEQTGAADFMAVVSALAEEVKGMKKAMQSDNLKKTEIEGQQNQKDQIDAILQSLINPVEEKGETK